MPNLELLAPDNHIMEEVTDSGIGGIPESDFSFGAPR